MRLAVLTDLRRRKFQRATAVGWLMILGYVQEASCTRSVKVDTGHGAAGQSTSANCGPSPGRALRLAAKLWPWPLVIVMAWTLGQFLVG